MRAESLNDRLGLMTEIAAGDGVRAIVLAGAGDRNFSVGMDHKQLPEGIRIKGGRGRLFDQRLKVISAIETMGKPRIATLFGYCLGGGLELPLGCHFRMAADEGAQIGLPETDLGTVPSWGGSARTEACGPRRRSQGGTTCGSCLAQPAALRW
jgi:enoyl-CoA hydratase